VDLFDDIPCDLSYAVADRDAALEQVADNAEVAASFMTRGLAAISAMPAGEFTGEDVRELLTKAGVVPHHPNAWGALVSKAVRDKLLTPTGERRPMRGPRSHARRTDVYRTRLSDLA
jgi:hypothetical protein